MKASFRTCSINVQEGQELNFSLYTLYRCSEYIKATNLQEYVQVDFDCFWRLLDLVCKRYKFSCLSQGTLWEWVVMKEANLQVRVPQWYSGLTPRTSAEQTLEHAGTDSKQI